LSLAATVAIAGMVGPNQAGAQSTPATSPFGSALSMTQAKGVPTVAIFTAGDHPASVELWVAFNAGRWARANRGLVQVVNVSRDRDPATVASMNIRQFPTVAVYRKSGERVGLAASMNDCTNGDDLAARLDSLDLGLKPLQAADPEVKTASFGHDVHPSQQYSPPTPQLSAPPPVSAPPPQMTTTMVPASTAGLIQVPSQNFVIQQQAPQVFLAPAQAPIVYTPQMMAPTVGYTPVAASTPNLFMPAATAPAPMMAVAAAPVAAPAPAAVAVAAAPVAAVTNNTLSVPTSRASTRVRVRGPGLIGSSLARLGERLTQFGHAKIETVHETTLESPYIQPAGGGLTTISTTSTAPVSPPQTTTLSIPQQSPPQVCLPPKASPQSSSHGHSLFDH
jgi:hypothetical protein